MALSVFIKNEGQTMRIDESLRQIAKVPERGENGEVIGALAIGRDITGRKQLELAIAVREQEFRSLAESSPDSIIRYDCAGRILYLNDRLLKQLELASAKEVIGKRPGEVWSDGRFAELERAAARAADSGSQVDIELVVPTENGAFHYHQIFVVPERDVGGQIVGTIAFGREITVIREAERRLKHFIDNMPGFAYTFRLSPDGHASFPFISPSIEKFYGLKPEDVQDDIAPLHSFWHPDDRMHIEAATAESARTMTPFRIESRVCRPGQPERWLDARALPEREADGSILWHGIMLDITERKQAEALLKERLCQIEELNSNLGESARNLRVQTEELAASQEHLKQTETWYRSILHSAPDGMVVTDARGVITQVNARIEAMFGYAKGELVGLPVERLLPPDVRENHVDKRTDFAVSTTNSLKSVSARGLRGCRKDGTEFPVDVSLSRLPDTDEKVGHVCAAIRDITERKKMERERINHLMRLEEISRNLVAAQEDARQRLACELHDRTSPNLAAIDINLNVIAAEIAQGTSTDLTERLEDIRALISDTSASIREIGAEMRPPLLDYAGLIAAMENYAFLFARRTGIQIYFECEKRDTRYTPQIESLLFRILQEALTNCSKHSSAESIRISLCNEIRPNILTITDDGVGFDPAQLGKTRKIGQGLLNMREMAEVAGVKIAIASTIGKGTSITLAI
ncbi:MAG TPA: PAS domain S-box protein [Gallionella sp.]|nr:PAS domain S-box protein [Gallionella sp.]